MAWASERARRRARRRGGCATPTANCPPAPHSSSSTYFSLTSGDAWTCTWAHTCLHTSTRTRTRTHPGGAHGILSDVLSRA
eukprot:5771710-Prymnesium_polylepis.1